MLTVRVGNSELALPVAARQPKFRVALCMKIITVIPKSSSTTRLTINFPRALTSLNNNNCYTTLK